MKIPRREARKIITSARRVLHRYVWLGAQDDRPGVPREPEVQEVSAEDLLDLFEANPRWVMTRRSDGTYVVEVPNIYAHESYIVEV